MMVGVKNISWHLLKTTRVYQLTDTDRYTV